MVEPCTKQVSMACSAMRKKARSRNSWEPSAARIGEGRAAGGGGGGRGGVSPQVMVVSSPAPCLLANQPIPRRPHTRPASLRTDRARTRPTAPRSPPHVSTRPSRHFIPYPVRLQMHGRSREQGGEQGQHTAGAAACALAAPCERQCRHRCRRQCRCVRLRPRLRMGQKATTMAPRMASRSSQSTTAQPQSEPSSVSDLWTCGEAAECGCAIVWVRDPGQATNARATHAGPASAQHTHTHLCCDDGSREEEDEHVGGPVGPAPEEGAGGARACRHVRPAGGRHDQAAEDEGQHAAAGRGGEEKRGGGRAGGAVGGRRREGPSPCSSCTRMRPSVRGAEQARVLT